MQISGHVLQRWIRQPWTTESPTVTYTEEEIRACIGSYQFRIGNNLWPGIEGRIRC